MKRVARRFEELREAAGDERDIAIDFHGAISPQTAKLLIKALEPYQPMFIEEPVQCQNVEVMADIARSTHLPIATGERIFTKWGFRELLEKGAATILQPDLCHAGGITEVRLIAGMAESHYAAIAPHNPLGPISLAAGLQIAGAIPNFLCQEQVHLGEGYITEPFEVRDGYIDLPKGPGLGVELDEDALAEKIGFGERRYDLIALLDVLEHVDQDEASLVALRGRLAAGGQLLVTVPAVPWLWSDHDVLHHHKRRYTHDALAGVAAAAGLRVEASGYFNSLLFPLAVAQRLMHQLLRRETPLDARPAPWLNRSLQQVFAAERHMLGRINFPIGLSLYAILSV